MQAKLTEHGLQDFSDSVLSTMHTIGVTCLDLIDTTGEQGVPERQIAEKVSDRPLTIIVSAVDKL